MCALFSVFSCLACLPQAVSVNLVIRLELAPRSLAASRILVPLDLLSLSRRARYCHEDTYGYLRAFGAIPRAFPSNAARRRAACRDRGPQPPAAGGERPHAACKMAFVGPIRLAYTYHGDNPDAATTFPLDMHRYRQASRTA